MKRILVYILLCVTALWATPPIDNAEQLPVVFIHGIGNGSQVWTPTFLSLELEADDISRVQYRTKYFYKVTMPEKSDRKIWVLGYYTPNFLEESLEGDLTRYAHRLTRTIDEIKYHAKTDEVIVVAHSMGGVIARKYMTLSRKNWQSVRHLITLGTPNGGVETSIPIVGQLRDLFTGSDFLTQLDQDWAVMTADQKISWSAIAAVRPRIGVTQLTQHMTDIAGPGYVTLASAFPQNEWKGALDHNPEIWLKGQGLFTHKILLLDDHVRMLNHPKVVELLRQLLNIQSKHPQ